MALAESNPFVYVTAANMTVFQIILFYCIVYLLYKMFGSMFFVHFFFITPPFCVFLCCAIVINIAISILSISVNQVPFPENQGNPCSREYQESRNSQR